MKRWLVGLLAWAPTAWADYADSTEPASLGLSKQMLCGVVSLGTGNIALLAGLGLALYGLWQMVRHGALKTGVIMLISGALITALPSLVISTLEGVGAWLQSRGVTDHGDLADVRSIAAMAGNCGNIQVDFSSYSEMPSWWSTLTSSGTGAPAGSDPTKRGYDRPAMMDPNAQTGTSGCMQLVEGGGPGSPFGPRRSVMTQSGRMSSSNHKGVDITCREGAAVKAGNGGGTVVAIGLGARGSAGYGNRVVLDAGNGKLTTYNHMSGFDSKVKMGGTIGAGETLGSCGQTGNATGPHLHYEVKENGLFKDPVQAGC